MSSKIDTNKLSEMLMGENPEEFYKIAEIAGLPKEEAKKIAIGLLDKAMQKDLREGSSFPLFSTLDTDAPPTESPNGGRINKTKKPRRFTK